MSEQEATLDEFVESEGVSTTPFDGSSIKSSLDETSAGKVPNDWDLVRLRELTEDTLYGANESAEEYNPENPRYIRIKDIDEQGRLKEEEKASLSSTKAEGYLLEQGDMLFARSGSPGRTYLHRKDDGEYCYGGYSIKHELVSEGLNHEYLSQYTKSPKYWQWIERISRTGAQTNINSKEYASLLVPLPKLEEQRKIASVLYTVDQAIQKTDEIIQQTERLHTALRRELVIAGIDHDEFQEMRVGPFTFEIPASWDIVPVDEACENLDKDRIPVKEAKREEMQGDIPYYGASGVIDYVDDYLFDDELILLAEDGENLLSRNLPIAFKISGKAWVNNHAHVLRPRQEFDIDYLVEYFERLNYEPFVTGSAQPKLTQTNMEMLSVPKPPEEEQAEISSVLTSVSVHKNRSEQYKEKLQRLKQGLMQDLLSGEVRTHDKDIEVVDDVLQHG